MSVHKFLSAYVPAQDITMSLGRKTDIIAYSCPLSITAQAMQHV